MSLTRSQSLPAYNTVSDNIQNPNLTKRGKGVAKRRSLEDRNTNGNPAKHYVFEASRKTIEVLQGVAEMAGIPLVKQVLEIGLSLIKACEVGFHVYKSSSLLINVNKSGAQRSSGESSTVEKQSRRIFARYCQIHGQATRCETGSSFQHLLRGDVRGLGTGVRRPQKVLLRLHSSY